MSPEVPDDEPTYRPHRLLAGGHRMTLGANFIRRDFAGLQAAATPRCFQTTPETQVLAQIDAPASGPPGGPTLLLLHGLTGDADADYMLGTAALARARGWRVVRMNMRNCGGTEHLTPTLYHSGLTEDLRAVAEALAAEIDAAGGEGPLVLGGFSMGGNVALKACGEWGAGAPVQGVFGVSPAVDLPAASERIRRGFNQIYEQHFLLQLKRMYRRKALASGGRLDPLAARGARRLRAFDDRIVAPHFGFDGADDYYRRASAIQVIERVVVPGLILHADDDPFVPAASLARAEIAGHPTIRIERTRQGGHVGFVRPELRGPRWMELRAVRFAEAIRAGVSVR